MSSPVPLLGLLSPYLPTSPRISPKVGDRIPYVMVKGAAKAKAWEKAEDPIFVLDNNLPLDTDWRDRAEIPPRCEPTAGAFM